jgi:hypothetical protein
MVSHYSILIQQTGHLMISAKKRPLGEIGKHNRFKIYFFIGSSPVAGKKIDTNLRSLFLYASGSGLIHS